MSDAVDATGRRVEEFSEEDAAERGYLSTPASRRRGSKNERLLVCRRRGLGDLESLKALRSWNFLGTGTRRASGARWPPRGAHGRENGALWGALTCFTAAESGQPEVLKWRARTAARGTQRTARYCMGACHFGRGILQARERLPSDVRGRTYAAPGGRFDILRARENGRPVGREDARARRRAAT